VRRFVDCLNDATIAPKVLDEIVSPEMNNHASGKKGADALKAIVAGLQKEAPDQKYVIDAIVAEGDLVVIRTTRTGSTQLDKFRGYAIKPGGKFTTTHAHFWRLKNGQIVEHWAVRDDFGMAQQLGAIAKP
jgi:predicted ester cyclase